METPSATKLFNEEAHRRAPRHLKCLLCGMFDETRALLMSSACQQSVRAEQNAALGQESEAAWGQSATRSRWKHAEAALRSERS